MSTYRDVIAEGCERADAAPIWHPTRWVAGVMLTLDLWRQKRHLVAVPALHSTDDTHEAWDTAEMVDHATAEEIRRADQAAAIATWDAIAQKEAP